MAMTTRPAETLTEEQCHQMMGTTTVGRVAFVDRTDGERLVLLPVNYRLSRGAIFFRTSADGPLAPLADHTGDVVFEVDHHDDLYQCGWSVVAIGTSRRAQPGTDIAPEDQERLRPWAAGDRSLMIRIEPRSMTGRRVERE